MGAPVDSCNHLCPVCDGEEDGIVARLRQQLDDCGSTFMALREVIRKERARADAAEARVKEMQKEKAE